MGLENIYISYIFDTMCKINVNREKEIEYTDRIRK
jgi:hypothetical protein